MGDLTCSSNTLSCVNFLLRLTTQVERYKGVVATASISSCSLLDSQISLRVGSYLLTVKQSVGGRTTALRIDIVQEECSASFETPAGHTCALISNSESGGPARNLALDSTVLGADVTGRTLVTSLLDGTDGCSFVDGANIAVACAQADGRPDVETSISASLETCRGREGNTCEEGDGSEKLHLYS